MNRKLTLLLLALSFCLIFTGFSYAPLTPAAQKYAFSYNHLTLGDTLLEVKAHFGNPRYDSPDYQHKTKLTYYYYKDDTCIGIDRDTGKVVDIMIKSDYYAAKNDPRLGDTLYRLDTRYGVGKRQNLEGKLLYPYAQGNKKLVFRLDPNTHAVESIRITTLPLEEDDTEYLPDDATDETLSPLIADKVIDTTGLTKPVFRPYHPFDNKKSVSR